MRAAICNTIDLKKLDKAIVDYEKIISQQNYMICGKFQNVNTDFYIIMSRETMEAIADETTKLRYTNGIRKAYMYDSHYIAIDDSIPYGEIELR